ncbi:Endoribonuclease L-PSP/chorismate mutase-like protein [Aspergillus stella-maris]|uniref:Endoribonuclease L-PSP/chorismate mutase-like protein n=1 Tax=Aspergillus stella-maris TaxID=1810926 RepID=UPI003CCCBFC5
MAPSKIHIRTDKAPAPSPYLSQATVVGNIAFCSGQLGIDPKTGKMVEGTVKDRTRQIIKNMSAVLEASGSSLADVAKVNIFLADMKDFKDMNEVYMEGFPEPRPARTCVAVKTLPQGSDVEIECSAVVTGSIKAKL